MKTLNIGCGKDYIDGAINVDIKPVGDFVVDITKGIPFGDNEFDVVIAHNILCQIRDNDEFKRAINELWRVCKGHIEVRVPNVKDTCAFQDPMDCRWFTPESFTYMENGHRRYNQYGKHYGFKPFQVEILEDNGHQMSFRLKPCK